MKNKILICFAKTEDEKKTSTDVKFRALSAYADNIVLHDNINGKYKAWGDGRMLYLSVTHTDNVVCVAVNDKYDLGIDMQKIEENYPKTVANRFYCENERQTIKESRDFYNIWTKKEAAVKLTGEGMGGMKKKDVTNMSEVKFLDLSHLATMYSGVEMSCHLCLPKDCDLEVYPIL